MTAWIDSSWPVPRFPCGVMFGSLFSVKEREGMYGIYACIAGFTRVIGGVVLGPYRIYDIFLEKYSRRNVGVFYVRV